MSVRARLVGTALVAVVILGGGCSGDPIAEHLESEGKQPYHEEPDDGFGVQAKDEPTEEFVATATAICGQIDGPLSAIQSPASLTGARENVRTIERVARDGADRLALLQAPDDASTMHLAAAVGYLRAVADGIPALFDAADRGDAAAAQMIATTIIGDLDGFAPEMIAAGVPDCV